MLEPDQIQSDKDIKNFFFDALKNSKPLNRQPREVKYYAKANGKLNLWCTKQPSTILHAYTEELMKVFSQAGESKMFIVPYIGKFNISESLIYTGSERTVHTPDGLIKVIDDPIDHLPIYNAHFTPVFRVMSNRILFNKYTNYRKINMLMLPEISKLGKPINFYTKYKSK